MTTTMPPLGAIKAGMRATWTAGDFGRIARYELASGVDLVRRLGLGPGDRVLDVACGPGVVARLAAPVVGASGRVVGADINEGMLAVA